ncbi:PepSY domain-containing protein [Synechococcus sp. B60.1]|uniref:PepSY domain-containing protein n=2 Tax=Synechococcus TaxID=1129 RepID=UPI0039C46F1D
MRKQQCSFWQGFFHLKVGRVRMWLLKQLEMKLPKLAVASLLVLGVLLLSSPMLSVGKSTEVAFAQSPAPAVRIEEAIQMARSAVPDAVIKEVELEREDGRLVWEVKFTNDVEVKIDATTGDVVDIDD